MLLHGLDLEARGFVKGARGALKCSLSLACEGVFFTNFSRCNFVDAILYCSAIQSEHHTGCILVVRKEMQYVLYQRKIELRTRSMSHLLSSADPVLYCDTNGPTHAPTVLSLASSTVCALLQRLRCLFALFIMLINSGEQCNCPSQSSSMDQS
jgi:hypothetical protein